MVRGCACLGIVLLLGCSQRSVSVDAAAADAGRPDTGPLPAGCQALAGFAGGVRIADLPAAQALFSASLDRVVLVTKPSAGYGDLVDVDLPGGEATTLEQGVVQAEWLGSGPELLAQKPLSTDPAAAKDLVVVPAGGGGSSSVAKGVCGHLAAPDGKRVYVVRSCVDGAGTLELVDLATGSAKQLGTGVDAGSLAVAADGQHAAFVAEVESTSGCTQPRGTAYLADPGGTTTSLAADTLVKSLQFLADGKLLLGVMKTCGGYAFQLTVADPADGSLQPVGSEHHYGTQGYFSRPRYAVSADGALVLGAGADLAEIQYELYGVAVDGSAETLLAGDLYPYMTVSAVYEAWAFAPGGVHVVYTPVLNPGQSPPRIGLASVTVPGGKRVLLSMDLQLPSHRVSPVHDEVAVLEQSGGTNRLSLVALDTATRQQLFDTQHDLQAIGFAPDGRGVLFVEAGGSTHTLRYVSREGGDPRALGAWQSSPLAYQVDPAGCTVLFNQDGQEGGAFLALLPPDA
jgi:hypothetical protein